MSSSYQTNHMTGGVFYGPKVNATSSIYDPFVMQIQRIVNVLVIYNHKSLINPPE